MWETVKELKALVQKTTATKAVIVSVIVCVAIIIIVFKLAQSAENSRKDISVWGLEIKIHDSDEVQALRRLRIFGQRDKLKADRSKGA